MLDEFLRDPGKVSVVLLLLAAVAAFMRGWIVTGSAYVAAVADCNKRIEQLIKERDEFKAMALRGLELTRRTIDVVSTLPKDV